MIIATPSPEQTYHVRKFARQVNQPFGIEV